MSLQEIKTLEQVIQKLEQQKEEAIKTEAYEKAGELKKKQEKKREKIDRDPDKMAEGKGFPQADC